MRILLRYTIVVVAVVVSIAHTPRAQSRLDVHLFGHRGFTRSVPENSLAASNAAVALGLAGAEIGSADDKGRRCRADA